MSADLEVVGSMLEALANGEEDERQRTLTRAAGVAVYLASKWANDGKDAVRITAGIASVLSEVHGDLSIREVATLQ